MGRALPHAKKLAFSTRRALAAAASSVGLIGLLNQVEDNVCGKPLASCRLRWHLPTTQLRTLAEPDVGTISRIAVLVLNLPCRYDIAQYLAGRYKWLAKLLFIVQLLFSWAIVVISTLFASWACRSADYCADGKNCAWWIVSDSSAISTLAETAFFLTVGASFLISFDSYINAKARANLHPSHPCA